MRAVEIFVALVDRRPRLCSLVGVALYALAVVSLCYEAGVIR